MVISNRSEVKDSNDQVLFGFENIKGFPVNMCEWSSLINILINIPEGSSKQEFDKAIVSSLNYYSQCAKNEGYYDEDESCANWDSCKDLEKYLAQYLFVEVDQVVVPSLNLKAAKKVICRNEKQKKKLRKMGFIEDRIIIKNVKYSDY